MRYLTLLLLLVLLQQNVYAQVPMDGKSNLDTSAVTTCAYLEECSLTTSNGSKIWCTELSVKTILLQHYSFPQLSDSATFVNRESYLLNLSINASGKIVEVNLTGCSNPVVQDEILKAVRAAKITFIPAKDKNGSGTEFTYHLKLRSYIFSRASLKGLVSPQKPMELSEEDQDIYKGQSLRSYNMN